MNTAARTSSVQATVSSARPAVPAGRAGRPHPALGWVLPALALLAFELLVRSGVLAAHLFPAPSEIVRTLFDLGSGLAAHIGVSLARVAGGFSIGASLAVIAAVVVGLDRRAEALLDPTFQALRAVPSLAWVPLLLLWLGIDETPKITLIAIGAFFPVYLNLLSGLRNVDRKLVELGEVYGLSSAALVRRILLPASLPSLYTGLRVGLSLAWMFLVAAELIAATRGLGYLLTDGRETSRPDIVLAAILLLAVLGKVSDSVLKSLEKRALVWRDALESRLA
jgi:sulfonate transport system permease protein